MFVIGDEDTIKKGSLEMLVLLVNANVFILISAIHVRGMVIFHPEAMLNG